MACLRASGSVNHVYQCASFNAYIYALSEPNGLVLQLSLCGRLVLRDIAVAALIMRDFMENAGGRSCYSIFDLRGCELFTIQHAQALASELQQLRSLIASTIVCSAVCISDSSTLNGIIKGFLQRFYQPVRPFMLCENGLNADSIVRQFCEEQRHWQTGME